MILKHLDRPSMERLIHERGIDPMDPEPWKKNLIGGSDDHSSLNIASAYTEVPEVNTLEAFFEGIGQNRGRVHDSPSGPKTLAHNIYSIAYQFYDGKFGLKPYMNKDPLLRFAHKALLPDPRIEEGFVDRLKGLFGYGRPGLFLRGTSQSMMDLIQREAREILFGDPMMINLLKTSRQDPREMEEAWYRFVNQVSEKILKHLADASLEKLSKANLFDIFQTIGSAGSLYTMLAPYFVAYAIFTKDRRFCRDCERRFSRKKSPSVPDKLKVVHFTDTFYDINGVAFTLRRKDPIFSPRHRYQAVSPLQAKRLFQTPIQCSGE